MTRTRTVATDQGFPSNGINWDVHDLSQALDPLPLSEDFDSLGFNLYVPGSFAGGASGFTTATLWGRGLLSLGPMTPAQLAFMSDASNFANLDAFPGEYIAFGLSARSIDTIEVGSGMADLQQNFFADPTINPPPLFDFNDLELYQSIAGMQFKRSSVTLADGNGIYGARIGGRTFSGGSTINFGEFFEIAGTSGADTLNGDNHPNLMIGAGGDDRIFGGIGNDTVQGGAGNDLIDGGADADRLMGESGDDRLFGGAGSDTIDGGDGRDYIDPGAGEDVIDGGAGMDTLAVRFSDRLIANFDAQRFAQSEGDGSFIYLSPTGMKTFRNIEGFEIAGTAAANHLSGDIRGDTLIGGGGNDWLVGKDGDDVLDGGGIAAVDYLDPALSLVVFEPNTPDRDITHIVSDRNVDLHFGLSANADIVASQTVPHVTVRSNGLTGLQDFFFYAAAGEQITVDVDHASFNSIVELRQNNVSLAAASTTPAGVDDPGGSVDDAFLTFTAPTSGEYQILLGQDNFSGGLDPLFEGAYDLNISVTGAPMLQANRLEGGSGNDTYIVSSSADQIVEADGQGSDTVRANVSYALQPGVSVERLVANDAAGTQRIDLFGNEIANVLQGNAGPNTLNGRGGADVLVGLGGDDQYFVDDPGDRVVEAAGQGNDRIFATTSYTLGAGVSVELLSTDFNIGTSPINLTGNELANTIYGNAGNNMLNGKGGADTLVGMGGDDWYFVDNAGDRILETAVQGNDRILSSVNYILGAGVAVELLSTSNNAGTGAINLTGNELANTIYGNAGNNLLDGNAGADTLVGLGGDDWYFVDNPGDVVVEGAGGGSDRIFARVDYTLGEGVAVELVSTNNNTGTTAINLTGNSQANTIYGNAGGNILDGKAGADTLIGLQGDDQYFVDNAADRIIEAAGEGSDRAFASVSYTLGAGVSVELLTTDLNRGTASIALTGNELANTIYGNAGANVLHGGGGDDTILGLGGNDQLFGDAGNDQFMIGAGFGKDVIADFANPGAAVGDTVRFLAGTFASFNDLMSKGAQQGTDAVFTLDANNSVTLHNVQLAALTAQDFIFG